MSDSGAAFDGLSDMLLDAREHASQLLNLLPAAVYVCAANGVITGYNERAADLWGRRPKPGDTEQRYSGAYRLFWPDGRYLPHDQTPIAQVLRTGTPIEDGEVVIERPDGSRIIVLVNIVALRNRKGEVVGAVNCFQDITERKRTEQALVEEKRRLEALNRVGALFAAELDLEKLVQAVTDAGVALTGAAFGAFFYNVIDGNGERYTLYTLSGVPREAFARFPMPRNTAVFAPTFHGEAVVRSDDITKDPRYGKNEPHRGMPKGHLPVRSYLAVPVVSRSGEVLGGLFFGHPQPRMFTAEAERLMVGIAAQAAICIDNARLLQAAQREIAERKRVEAELKGSETRLRDLLEGLPAAVYTTDAAGRIVFYNEAAAEFWGHRPELGKSEWCGSWRLYWPDGTKMPHDQCPMAMALKENRPIRGAEAVAERPDGTRVPFIPYPTPMRDASGTLVGAVNMLVDITERKRAEQFAQQLAAIVESSDDAIASKDLNGIIATWNKGAERLFGYTAEEVIGKPVTILIPEDRHDEEPSILERIRRGEPVNHCETVRRRKDGSLIDISLTVSPVKDGEGRIIGASKIARDITERKRAEARLHLLAREVDHRAKNMLAVIQAMVRFTRAETVPDFAAAIDGRIRALAHAHSLLSESRWEGADFKHLVAEELAPYHRGGESRVRLDGPNVALVPSAAQSMAVAIHELATNAAKYGAFTAETGHVSVQWSQRADGGLMLRWVESKGPPVRRPLRQGFGTRVIERTMHEHLDGAVRFDWRPEGLVCEIDIPAAALAPMTKSPS